MLFVLAFPEVYAQKSDTTRNIMTKGSALIKERLVMDTMQGSNHKTQQDAGIAYNTGLAYFEQNNYEEALKAFTKAIEFDKEFTNAYLNRGITLLELQKFRQAIDDFDQVINVSP